MNTLTTSTNDDHGDYFGVVRSTTAQYKLTKGNIKLSGFNNDLGNYGNWTVSGHDHDDLYDDYGAFKIKANTGVVASVNSGNTLQFIEGGGTSISRSGLAVTVAVGAAPITFSNSTNTKINFNDSSAYWLAVNTNWGVYWNASSEQIEFHNAGTEKLAIDLDNGNIISQGKVFVGGSGGGDSDDWNSAYNAGASRYTLPTATSTTLGGIKLGSATQQSVAANTATSTAGKTYPVQLNASNQAVVNVPWTGGSGGGGDTVTIHAKAADILSVSSGEISAVDATKDKLVFWDESADKLKYLTFDDLAPLPAN